MGRNVSYAAIFIQRLWSTQWNRNRTASGNFGIDVCEHYWQKQQKLRITIWAQHAFRKTKTEKFPGMEGLGMWGTCERQTVVRIR